MSEFIKTPVERMVEVQLAVTKDIEEGRIPYVMRGKAKVGVCPQLLADLGLLSGQQIDDNILIEINIWNSNRTIELLNQAIQTRH